MLGVKAASRFARTSSVKMVAPASRLALLLLDVSVRKDSQAIAVRLTCKVKGVSPTHASMVALALLKASHQPIAVHAQKISLEIIANLEWL